MELGTRTSPQTQNSKPLEWKHEKKLVEYLGAEKFMQERALKISQGISPEMVWLLEHSPLYTIGTSAKPQDILPTASLPTYATGRGGQVTYHGPGQRIAYVMLDLGKRGKDVRQYIFQLEQWLINTLHHFGIQGERRPDRIGIWVQEKGQDYKIAALGIRVQKWVTLHGIALNINPDLANYQRRRLTMIL